MKIFMLWGQRRCTYSGQYAPELLETVDEYTMDDNPAALYGQEEKYRKSHEFTSFCIISAEVDNGLLERTLSITEANLTKVKIVE